MTLEANEIKENNVLRSNDTGSSPTSYVQTIWFAILVMQMWLRKVFLLSLPFLENFKQDVALPSSKPTMLTFASTWGLTVQLLKVMLSLHSSWLCGLDQRSHLHLKTCMFSLVFCIFQFILVMYSSCSRVHD